MRKFLMCGILTPALLLTGASIGCSREEEPELIDRYARLFRPFVGKVIRESAMPARPQKYPQMVIWEVSEYAPGTKPTKKQRRAAADLVERCRAAVVEHGWNDEEKGRADGFSVARGADGTVLDDVHYMNSEFMLDDRILDCDHPEYLMYYAQAEKEPELVGFMFYVRSLAERGPQIGGPRTVWHFHRWTTLQCWDGMLPVGWAMDGKTCDRGVGSHRSPEMLHVWLIDRPNGPFSTSMHVPAYLDVEGLDAPFVPPVVDDLEAFTAQLDAAIARLNDGDRHLASQAVSFLGFAFGKGFTIRGKLRVDAGDRMDPETRGRLRLLRIAQKTGRSMRLKKYVSLAFELDQVKPEIWTEYEAIHGVQEAPHHHH